MTLYIVTIYLHRFLPYIRLYSSVVFWKAPVVREHSCGQCYAMMAYELVRAVCLTVIVMRAGSKWELCHHADEWAMSSVTLL